MSGDVAPRARDKKSHCGDAIRPGLRPAGVISPLLRIREENEEGFLEEQKPTDRSSLIIHDI
jgi:hypothetical protein